MKKKYYLYSLGIITLLLVFVFVNESKSDYYSLTVEDAHKLLQTEEISVSQQALLDEDKSMLILNVTLESGGDFAFDKTATSIEIPVESLLERKFVKFLKNHDKLIVLKSDNSGLAVHAWIMLTRKGVQGVKLLNVQQKEEFHYTFTPEK